MSAEYILALTQIATDMYIYNNILRIEHDDRQYVLFELRREWRSVWTNKGKSSWKIFLVNQTTRLILKIGQQMLTH